MLVVDCLFMNKAQTSIELLMVVAIALAILVPASIAFFDYAQDTSSMIVASQINILGNNLINKAEEMYVLGSQSWTTLDFSVPNEVINASIVNQTELFINYRTPIGTSQAVFFSTRFRITNGVDSCIDPCSIQLDPGTSRYRIQSFGQNVSIIKN